jgi:hypothetical protein
MKLGQLVELAQEELLLWETAKIRKVGHVAGQME